MPPVSSLTNPRRPPVDVCADAAVTGMKERGLESPQRVNAVVSVRRNLSIAEQIVLDAIGLSNHGLLPERLMASPL